MALVPRVQRILRTPNTEWPVIAEEPATAGSLYAGYIVPLAAIPAVAGFIGRLFVVHNVAAGIVFGLASFAGALIAVYVIAIIAAALAPSFGGTGDRMAGLKWAAYSQTAGWVAGIFLIIPIFGSIVAILGSLYSLYLFYLGTVPVMRVSRDKALGYAIVVILIEIVVSLVVGGLIGIAAFHALGPNATTGAASP